MTYDVTSWFIDQTLLQTPNNLVRKFSIGSSDYSDRVITWPKFDVVWDGIRSVKLNVKLANQDSGMNFMREDKTLMRENAKFEFGYAGFNLIQYSEQIGTSPWVGPAIITNNFYDAPNGEHTASRFQNLGSINIYKQQSYTSPIADQTYTFGVWLKLTAGSFAADTEAFIRISGDVAGLTINYIGDELNDEWQYFTVTGPANSSPTSIIVQIRTDVFSTLAIWGAQLVTGTNIEHYKITEATTYSEDELITLFAGKTERIKYQRETTEMTIVDKFKQLTQRVMGTSEIPVDYTGSDYLPADIAWYAITSYGGFDNVQSSSNVDIDYDAWLAWSNVFSADAVKMQGLFKGTKVIEVLRKIGRHTLSAIYISEDRLSFHRFSSRDLNVTSFDNNTISDLILEFNDADIINKQIVLADFNVDSDQYGVTVNDVSTFSVNSFGLREDIEEDGAIWYSNSASAINLAQRIILTKKEPFDSIRLQTNLSGFTRLVGESISIVDSFHSIDGGFRIMSQRIDMDKSSIEFNVDKSQYLIPFILDTSTLDSISVLT